MINRCQNSKCIAVCCVWVCIVMDRSECLCWQLSTTTYMFWLTGLYSWSISLHHSQSWYLSPCLISSLSASVPQDNRLLDYLNIIAIPPVFLTIMPITLVMFQDTVQGFHQSPAGSNLPLVSRLWGIFSNFLTSYGLIRFFSSLEYNHQKSLCYLTKLFCMSGTLTFKVHCWLCLCLKFCDIKNRALVW